MRPTTRTAEEQDMAAEPEWTTWVYGLLDHRAVRDATPVRPTAMDVETIAIRAQVAHDLLKWSREDLARRVLLVRLERVEHLGSVWAARLHPERLGPPPAQEEGRTRVEQGQGDLDAMPPRPSPGRIAEIRELFGGRRGTRWNERMGG